MFFNRIMETSSTVVRDTLAAGVMLFKWQLAQHATRVGKTTSNQ